MPVTSGRPDVSAERILRRLGVPDAAQPARSWLDLATRVSDWYAAHGRPWSVTEELRVERIAPGRVRLERGAELVSDVLASGFAATGVASVVLVAVSAGAELDLEVGRLQANGLPDVAWFLSAYGACVAERLRDTALAGRPGLLPAYAPGYRGWPLADQAVLYSLLDDHGPLRLGASSCLTPLRSCIAVAGMPTRAIARAGFWTGHGGHECKGDCQRCDCSNG